MPKGRTRHQGNMGGQRRITQTTCGWGCSGHPSEVNKKFQRHKKFCNDCKSMVMPKYDPIIANSNGWKGTNADGRPDERIITAVVEGVPMNLDIRGETTIDNVFKKAEKIINPTRSLCSNCHQLPVAPNRKCFDDWCERCDEALYSTKTKEIDNDEKRELLGKVILEKVPSDIIEKFLDKYEDSEEDGGMELAELAGKHMTLKELNELIKILSK